MGKRSGSPCKKDFAVYLYGKMVFLQGKFTKDNGAS